MCALYRAGDEPRAFSPRSLDAITSQGNVVLQAPTPADGERDHCRLTGD